MGGCYAACVGVRCEMFEKKVLSQRLKNLLRTWNISQETLAYDLGMNKNTITNYCNGRYRTMPKLDNLYAIANYFEVKITYLINEDEEPNFTGLSRFMLKFKDLTMQEYGIDITKNGGFSHEKSLEYIADFKELTEILMFPRQIGGLAGRHLSAMFSCSKEVEYTRADTLYPRTDIHKATSRLCGGRIEYDNYYIVKGNIYRITDIANNRNVFSRNEISIYDYVNEGNSLEPYIKAYKKERFNLGFLGILSANEFYMLCYIMGHYFKHLSIPESGQKYE
jgi:transcriptional regulator with XRE-family HTH domain